MSTCSNNWDLIILLTFFFFYKNLRVLYLFFPTTERALEECGIQGGSNLDWEDLQLAEFLLYITHKYFV